MTFPRATTHGPIQQIRDNLYFVRGSFPMAPGMRIGRTMTIVRTDEGLVILNSVRLKDERELDALGPVKHVIKLSDSHGIDDPYYVDHYGAQFWCLEGAKDAPPTARTLGSECPIPGARLCELKNTRGWLETTLLLPGDGGTMIATDVLQNYVDQENVSLMARLMTPLMGFKGGLIIAPMWRKFQKIKPGDLPETMASVLSCDFDTLVCGHGPPIVGAAAAKVQAAVKGLAAA